VVIIIIINFYKKKDEESCHQTSSAVGALHKQLKRPTKMTGNAAIIFKHLTKFADHKKMVFTQKNIKYNVPGKLVS